MLAFQSPRPSWIQTHVNGGPGALPLSFHCGPVWGQGTAGTGRCFKKRGQLGVRGEQGRRPQSARSTALCLWNGLLSASGEPQGHGQCVDVPRAQSCQHRAWSPWMKTCLESLQHLPSTGITLPTTKVTFGSRRVLCPGKNKYPLQQELQEGCGGGSGVSELAQPLAGPPGTAPSLGNTHARAPSRAAPGIWLKMAVAGYRAWRTILDGLHLPLDFLPLASRSGPG